MKHRNIAIVSVAGLLLSLMVWSFGSSAAGSKATANNSIEANGAIVSQQGDEDEFVDADLGKFG